jgi:signal transduction histidine kinase
MARDDVGRFPTIEGVIESARSRDLLRTVFRTSLVLCADLDLQPLLTKLLALTKEALGVEASSVMLVDQARSTLYWEVTEGGTASSALKSITLPIGEGIAGAVAQSGTAIIVPDARRDPRVSTRVDAMTGFQTRSILCVPIRFRGTVLGVIQLLNKEEGTFNEQDQELLELIAAEAGVAIENAQLYGTLEERVRLRTKELADANAQLTQALGELKQAQTRLIQSEKMAALGNLVAGVAHEINTPLGAIASNTDILNRGLRKLTSLTGEQGDSTITMLAQLIQTNAEACRRISAIVKDLKTFSRLDEAEWKSADLREGMETTLTLVHHLHKDRITIIREYGDIPPTECRPGQINQVFMNLLVNAVQAIEGTGTIWIRMKAEGGTIRVEVQDTGIGIAPEHLGKIFDPGFTTKGVGVGTGLGLSICHQIMADHQGSIQVVSERGRGSTFTLILPIRAGA